MTEDLYWIYAFNIIVNSTISFLTVFILVKLFLFILRIDHPRLKMFFLSIPILKIIFDLFLYDFSRWSLLHHINPLASEPGTRMLSVLLGIYSPVVTWIPLTTAIQFVMQSGTTFTIADLAALSLSPFWIKGIVILTAILSVIICGSWMYRLYKSTRWLSTIAFHAENCRRPIFNLSLLAALRKRRIEIIMTSEKMAPGAFGFFHKRIIFPKDLAHNLSQEEFEAVVAHELEHLRWNDCTVRLFKHFVCSFFWWIPTKWCLTNLEQSQEQACDSQINTYKLSREALASAIVKAIKHAKGRSCLPVVCLINRNGALARIQSILTEPKKPRIFVISWLKYSLATLAMLILLFGKFWIF